MASRRSTLPGWALLAALAAAAGFVGERLAGDRLAGLVGWRPGPEGPGAAPAQDEPHPRWAVVGILGLAVIGGAGLLGWKGWEQTRQTQAVAIALTRGDPSRAPDLIRRYGCGGCHTIPGISGADGKVAQRLDRLRQQVYVGGVARNGGETLVRWIVDPQSLSPRSAMPATGISEAEARDVAAWLYSR